MVVLSVTQVSKPSWVTKTDGQIYFDVSLNGAYNKTKCSISATQKRLQGGDGGFGQSGVLYAEVGTPMGVFYGVKTDGIFQNQAEIDSYVNENGGLIQPKAKPADIKFIDADGNGSIDGDADRPPDWLTLSRFHRRFEPHPRWLRIRFQHALLCCFRSGRVYDATRRYDMNGTNYRADWLKPLDWRRHIELLPTSNLFVDDNQNMKTVSDFFVHDGSFLRLRNITLGYTIPKSKSDYLKVSKIRLYVSAENLFDYHRLQ